MNTIILTEQKDRVLYVTFNNPDVLNAMVPAFVKAFAELLTRIEEDETIEIVILTGTGRAFIAGADIKNMLAMSPTEAAISCAEIQTIYRRMEAMDKIFIAAVNGFALGGGCETALACDLRIASEKAKFGLPEVSLGIIPGGGGTQRLPRLIGEGRAKELIYSGRVISAEEAERIGLVNRVAAPETLLDAAAEMAAGILKNSGAAVKTAKDAINRGIQVDLTTGVAIENALFALCFAAPDQKEGMTAFVEKRPANYGSQRAEERRKV
jgi:enoyl-CoA hydratase